MYHSSHTHTHTHTHTLTHTHTHTHTHSHTHTHTQLTEGKDCEEMLLAAMSLLTVSTQGNTHDDGEDRWVWSILVYSSFSAFLQLSIT